MDSAEFASVAADVAADAQTVVNRPASQPEVPIGTLTAQVEVGPAAEVAA